MPLRQPAANKKPWRERGPREWLFPNLEWLYTKLVPREQPEVGPSTAEESVAVGTDEESESFRSTLHPDRGENVLAAVNQDLWLDRLAEYKHRLGMTDCACPLRVSSALAL
jgi:hypothetical protein